MAIEWTTTEQRAPRLIRHKLMVCESAGEGFNVTTLTGEATREDLLRACEAAGLATNESAACNMCTSEIAELKAGRHDARQAEALAVVRASAAELRAEKAEALLREALALRAFGPVFTRIRAHLAEADK